MVPFFSSLQNESVRYSPSTTQEPYTITEIHFPVIKLPTVSGSSEEDEPEEKSPSASCVGGETNVNSLSTKCIPVQALLTIRLRKRHRVTKLPQYFIPLRNVLEMYPSLLLQLMKVCADFVCQFPTQAMLRRCTVEESRQLSAGTVI